MEFEAVVVGSGPNGLAAAIEVARAGHSVCVLEARDTIGGGARSAEFTLNGFIHDVCSAIYPMAFASPFFNSLPLAKYGLEWIHPAAALAHTFDDGTAAVLEKSVERTAAALGGDARAYTRCFAPLAEHSDELMPELLSPLIRIPRHPFLMASFGIQGIQAASGFARRQFRGVRAQALFGGIAAHSNMPLDAALTATFGLILGMLGHAGGWPIVKGGAQRLSEALGAHLQSLGGRIFTGRRVKSFHDLPPAKAVFFDLAPREILAITGNRFSPSYRKQLESFRHGPGVFKVDWALSGHVPWKAPECLRAGTVHIGGTLEEISISEKAAAEGRIAERPFVLFAQQTLFDPSRAPAGQHTAWGYCHVPNGSTADMTGRIEAQIERFAPGFRDCIIGRHTISATDYEAYNPNLIGGDISGGLMNIRQVLARPTLRRFPYRTPVPGLFICSSSTPPGGAVHGMCGYHAARAALSGILGRSAQS
ncbi:MAG TPA: NAD(P)/FAD-dependent oxidoreductase [Terriglobia bacterium]